MNELAIIILTFIICTFLSTLVLTCCGCTALNSCINRRKNNDDSNKKYKITLNGNNETIDLIKYKKEQDPLKTSFDKQNMTMKDFIEMMKKYTENKNKDCDKKNPEINKVDELPPKDKVFVFNFNDMETKIANKLDKSADVFDMLFEFINYVMINGKPTQDKVIIRIKSPGGYAFKFEEAYTKLVRLKNKGFEVIGVVDSICCSGGYMLACACSKIVAADTAMVGSIGVIGETFNFKELADKIGVKFFRFKTSEVKGGFPSSTEWTDKDIENTMEDINRTLEQFKNIVTTNRPNINHELAFTAKVWYGKQSIDLGLIDEIGIYDDVIISFVDSHDIFVVTEKEEDIMHKLFEKIPFSSSFLTDFVQNLTTHNKVKNVIC